MGGESCFRNVKGPVFAGSDREGRVNAGFVRTAKGTLVVDTLVSREDGRALLRAALAQAGPVTALTYTHEHVDHTLGSAEFPPGGVIASEGTARGIAFEVEELARAVTAEGKSFDPPRAPTLVFDTKVRLPWEPEVVIVELGGHAEGSSVVYVPEHKVLFSGDLVFRGRAAWVGGIQPERWLAALRTLEGWDVDVVVPGHGPVGGREVLAEQRMWLERFLARAGELRAGGAGVDEATGALAAEFGFAERQLESLRLALWRRLGFGQGA